MHEHTVRLNILLLPIAVSGDVVSIKDGKTHPLIQVGGCVKEILSDGDFNLTKLTTLSNSASLRRAFGVDETEGEVLILKLPGETQVRHLEFTAALEEENLLRDFLNSQLQHSLAFYPDFNRFL